MSFMASLLFLWIVLLQKETTKEMSVDISFVVK